MFRLFHWTLLAVSCFNAGTLSLRFASITFLQFLLEALVYLTISYSQAVNIPLNTFILMQYLVNLPFESYYFLLKLILLEKGILFSPVFYFQALNFFL